MDHRSQHAVANALRHARLLPLADLALYAWSVLKKLPANLRFRSVHAEIATPPSHLAFDAYGHVDRAAYLASGEKDARIVAETVNRWLPGSGIRVCEWGCGPGRVIRHLRQLLSDRRASLYGTDYNEETVEWCRASLEGIAFERNGLSPPLPFTDEYLDCVYALSVFTHLSDARHFEWIAELKRVIRPGGIVILTTHSDAATDRLLGPELARYKAGELVVRGQVKEGKKWFLAYQPPGFVRNELLAGWEVLSHAHARMFGTQDLWVARKPLGTAQERSAGREAPISG